VFSRYIAPKKNEKGNLYWVSHRENNLNRIIAVYPEKQLITADEKETTLEKCCRLQKCSIGLFWKSQNQARSVELDAIGNATYEQRRILWM
jgi:transcriptional accessory protein Tex/SPT6